MKVGDLVEFKNKDYLVVKVNQKSVYISENMNFIELWEDRPKGSTWKDFCKRKNAITANPEQLKIKQESFVKVIDKKKEKVVSSSTEKILKESFERFKKKEKGEKTKTPTFLFEAGVDKIFTLKADTNTKNILFKNLRKNSYHIYNVDFRTFFDFDSNEYNEKKEINWPSL